MYTVQVSAERLNQIRAALDDRVAIMQAQIARLEVQESSEDRDRALVWSIDALFETERARDDFADLDAVLEQADPLTAAKGYHDWQAAGPISEPELIAGYGLDPADDFDRDSGFRESQPEFNGAFR
jgi:hypothetical protein